MPATRAGTRSTYISLYVEMFPGRVSVFSWAWRRRNCLRLKNGIEVAVRVCRSIKLVTKGRMWVLQAARNERCRITLMGGHEPRDCPLRSFQRSHIPANANNSVMMQFEKVWPSAAPGC
jgi:hypothetical protein